jgi:hypothetical protein
MKVYNEIKALTKELSSTKIRQRRAAGETLQQRLSMTEVRRRLAQEAGAGGSSGSSVAIRRRRALAEMWRAIILQAVLAVQTIARSNSKLTVSDILMPFKLLRCCDLPDTTDSDVPPQYEPSKLSRRETKKVFSYCYDMLQDETAVELAEVQLLEMLAYLCARKEYVANMRPHLEIHAVVQEVELRLIAEDENSVPPEVVLVAGQIFENILKTTNQLRVGMHLLMPGCVKIVAAWCVNNLNRDRVRPTGELPHIMRGLSILLKSDAEQAIAPLTRHGRPILSFAKRRYATVDESHRGALNEYFLSHL